MRQRSENWAKLAVRGRFSMDVVAVIGGVTYTAISAPVIDRTLLSDTLSVGNCTAASLKVSVLTSDKIDKAASVVIKARIFNGDNTSEWLEFGTFYIDKRDTNNGLTTLQCYDSMLKASQNYVDPTKPDDRIGWPKSMQTCVSEIAERIGVEIDHRTVINTSEAYQVTYPTNYTMKQVLEYIAAVHGGNWIITPENKLRLVPLVTPSSETFDIIDYEYNKIHTDDGYKLVWQHYETGETVSNPAGGDLLNVPVVIGKIATGKTETISRITIARDEKLGYTKGDDTGIELRIENNPYASQAICDDLYAQLSGLVYAPFTIAQACYDPCAELGDWILVGEDVRSVIYSQTVTLGVDFRADAAAPSKDESGEYPYLTEIQKLHRDDERLKAYMEEAKDEIDSKIEQTHTAILLEVGGTYSTKEEVNTSIALTELSIAAEVTRAQQAEDELRSSLQITDSKIEAKVSHGDVCAAIKLETTNEGADVEINGDHLIVNSTNFKLSKMGEVDASGSFTSTDALNSTTSTLQGGTLTFKKDGQNVLTVLGSLNYGTSGPWFNAQGASSIMFSVGSTGYIITFQPNGFISCGSISVAESVSARYVNINGGLDGNGYIVGGLHFPNNGISGGMNYDPYMYAWGSGVMMNGDFNVLGSKNRVVTTEHFGNRALSAMESAMPVFSDMGSAVCGRDGIAYVDLDPIFAETVDVDYQYHVFLTQIGDKKVECIMEKTQTYFTVKGEAGAKFDWIIYLPQKGYSNDRLIEKDLPELKQIAEYDMSIFESETSSVALCETCTNDYLTEIEKIASQVAS